MATDNEDRPSGLGAGPRPLVLIAIDRRHRGMSALVDRSDSVGFLASRRELVPNLRVAREARATRAAETPIVVVIPSGSPALIPIALAGGADRIVSYHTMDAPRSRWTEVAMRAAGAVVDWVITPDLASLKCAVRHGADADRIDVVDLDSVDAYALFQRIALEPRRREPAAGTKEAMASLALDALDASGALALAERLGGRDGVNVINYHRILPFDELRTYCRPQMAMAASVFEAQIEALAPRGFVAVDALKDERAAGRIAITFDDGYEDNFRVALPILQRFSVPACIFVVTGLIGAPGALWWDRVGLALFAYWRAGSPVPIPDELPRRARALEHVRSYHEARAAITDALGELNRAEAPDRERAIAAAEALVGAIEPARTMLSWAEIEQMRALGVSFGAHTRTHVSLDMIDPEAARDELVGSIGDLEARLPGASAHGRVAALPRGKLGPFAERDLEEMGFVSVMSTDAGKNPINREGVMVKRRDGNYLTLRGRHHAAKMRLELSGVLDRIRREHHD